MGQTIAELKQKVKTNSEPFHKTTFYTWNDKRYPILQKHNFTRLADSILKMNEINSYVSVVNFGKSGSGKSTLTTSLIHRISCKSDKKYVIKWFERTDLTHLDTIIDDLPKGLRYILIFDDVSYVLDQVSSKRKKELAGKLTHIRHDLKGKVITIMNIHFMTALLPIMRDADFKIITSMSDQDAKNFKNTLGWDNKYAIDRFQRQYSSQMMKGYFFINGVDNNGKSYCYKTNQPFRIAQVSEGAGGIHPVLVPQEFCENCTAKKVKPKQMMDPEVFYQKCLKGYTQRAKTAIGYWAYLTHGKKECLPANNVRCLNWINKMVSTYGIDIDKLSEVIVREIERGKGKKILTKTEKKNFSKHEAETIQESGIDSNISKYINSDSSNLDSEN